MKDLSAGENQDSTAKDKANEKIEGAPDVNPLQTTAESTGLENIEQRHPGLNEDEAKHVEPPAADPDQAQVDWFENVYQGDDVPQFTWRAVIMGGILGSLMSLSNLYTTLKLGWAFGVAITACVLSFVIWDGIRAVFPRLSAMTILENNCMQSTASAAGYSTGSTIATAFGAYLLITGHQVEWQICLAWTFITAGLGVFLAVPMKRQMINYEQLAFPSGIAAAQTLRSLYGRSKEAIYQAYGLVTSLVVGVVVGFLSKGEYFLDKLNMMFLKLPDILPFDFQIMGVSTGRLPAFGFEPSVLLVGAGMIVGMRVSLSMLLGACLLYLYVGPLMLNQGQIPEPSKLIKGWSLWTGTALMVTSGLTAFAVQWKTIVRAVSGVRQKGLPSHAKLDAIEVPAKWFLAGVIPLTIAMAILEYVAFSIALPLGILSVVLSFFLALVACRATGETDITPIGPMGKITQLTYALLSPNNMVTNLMAASVTANTASSSADLLTDLKSGYLLGANPRKQFLAQFIGIFFGTVAVVPAWYLMVPSKAVLESYNPPSTNMWRAVAEALAGGIQYIPITARYGILIGGVLGIMLALCDHFLPKSRKFMPSAMGLGLSWVVPFANSFAFFIGAFIAWLWVRVDKARAETFTVPIASGAIAGESLACAIIAIINAAIALAK